MRQGPGLLSPDMESADLEEQLRIYARDKEDSGSAYALEALKREFPKTSSLLLTKPIGAQARLWEPVQLSSATVRTSPGMSRNRALSTDGSTTRNSWRTLRLSKQALIALTPPQIRSLSAFRIRVQRSRRHVVWYSAMFRAERQQTFSPSQPRPWSPIQRRHHPGGHSQFAPEADSGASRTGDRAQSRALVAWHGNGEFRSDGNSLTSHLSGGRARRALLVVKSRRMS